MIPRQTYSRAFIFPSSHTLRTRSRHRLQGCPSQDQRVERAEQSCAAQPCHAFRSQSTSSKNNVPATGFALYGAMGLKPSDLSSAAASFIDGSVSNLILAYTSPDRG